MSDQISIPNLSSARGLSILHISDLHFGPPLDGNVAESLVACAAEIPFDLLVVSGDLTQRARREQFLQAREFMERLPAVPRLVIPGNHDVPLYNISRRLTDPHRNYRESIQRDLNPVLRLPGAVLVGLDSTAPRMAISNGRIHQWQLDLCTQAFSNVSKETLKIVVAHHHFAPAPDYLRDSTMPKAKRAIMHFVELGVDAILGGHLHRAFIGNSLDFYPGSHRDRGIVIAQCGTTTSQRGRGRERQKNTFNLIYMDQETIKVTHYMYFHRLGFVPTSSHEFFRMSGDGSRPFVRGSKTHTPPCQTE